MASANTVRRRGIAWPAWLQLSWSWRITWIYLALVLFLPLGAMALKAAAVGPSQFWQLATTPEALATYRVSFGLSLAAALSNGVFGVVIAWALVRCTFPGRRLLAGLALAAIYSTNGWLGAPLYALFGLKVSFTWLGVAIAMVFISLPFVVRSVEPVLEALERDQEEAAWCLGASPWQTLTKVVLPQLMPAILAGVAQGYSRAVGEYGSVVMISSNVPFKDLIAPTLIIQKLEEYDFASATVIGMVMLLFSLLSLLVINGLQVWGRNWEAYPAQST
jgi:sulfate transport system permease protein